ncbi:exclusion suppressor FxsA [Martelella endophytica]|uniref:Exclusion suppressor FxsA n=1 Tax=Martelella endophytica TaxID=1486262 RepID=A0A0D5LM11_MAREN|nr:exclusion suppressor FxsA [Martelella endophytica]
MLPFLIAIILFPFIEIAGFIVVGRAIGLFPTLGLIMLTAVIGAILLRVQGFGVLQRLNTAASDGGDPGREMIHGAMIVLAGILLLIPGFVTDILGLLLFIPPVRDLVWKHFRNNMVVVSSRSSFFGGGAAPRGPQRPGGKRPNVVDLDASDFSSDPDPNSPWADRDDKRLDDDKKS